MKQLKMPKVIIIKLFLIIITICFCGILLSINCGVIKPNTTSIGEVNLASINNEHENAILAVDENSSSDGTYNIFGVPITAQEIICSAAYPSQAITAMKASKEATAKAKEFYEDGKFVLFLGNGDAFRHSYWNALMERRISKNVLVNVGTSSVPNYVTQQIDFAKMFAEAHEYGKTGVDPEMDLLNNAQGRVDGATYNTISDDQLAYKIMERVSLGYYWKIINQIEDSAGNFLDGDLAISDSQGLKQTYFDEVMFDTTIISDSEIRLENIKWNIKGVYNIPSTISGKTVTQIGSNAFMNQNLITSIVFPSTINYIGDNAFKNCSNLTSVSGLNNITHIGNGAFANCTSLTSLSELNNVENIGTNPFVNCNNLEISVSNNNNFYSAIGNILYNKDKTKIISSGKIDANITILDSVTEIMPYAFKGNINLNTMRFGSQNTVIGKFAFSECNNLNTVYFDSYDRPQMGELAFPSNNFALYTPYIARTSYGDIFAHYTTNLQSETFNLSLTIDGNTETKSVYYGADIVELVTPIKIGHTFVGWYDNVNYSGNVYPNSGVWETKNDVALYAKLAPNKYNIYFKGNGITNLEPKEVIYGNAVGILPQVEREGYTFLGWEADNGQVYTSNTVWQNTNDIILTAEWSANEYVITLDTVGGAGNGQNLIIVTFNSSFSTTNIPTREGYTFEGWYDSQNVKYITVNGESTRLWDQPKDTTLYAQWAIKSYEIQINNNGTITWLGASGLSDEQCSIEYGTKLIAINLVPTFKATQNGYKEGQIFDRFEFENRILDWPSVPDLGKDGEIVTIIPKWELERHTIYFNTQTSQSLPAITLNYGTSLTLPVASANGKTFKGWYTSATGGTEFNWTTMPDLTPLFEKDYSAAQSDGATQLYAQYDNIDYTIKYVLDGGTNSSNNPSFYTVESEIKFEDATKYGCNFAGWYLDADKTDQIINLKLETGNKTLYAKWSPKVIGVALDRQGGSGGSNSVNATYGSAMPSATAPSRKGYIFKGYYTRANGVGTQYYNSSMTSQNNYNDINLTSLYAYWVANEYEVTLNYGYNATSGTRKITARYDDPMPTISLPGYWAIAFEGYYTGENGSGVKYYDYKGNSLKNWDIDRATTLYANWVQTLAMGEPDDFSSGGLSTSFKNWNTYIDFSSKHSSGYAPLNYNQLKNIGYSKVQFGFGGMFDVYGKIIVEVRCYNMTTSKQIGDTQTFTSANGVDADLAFNFETNLSDISNGNQIVIQMKYRKAHIWGGDFKIVDPKLYAAQAF